VKEESKGRNHKIQIVMCTSDQFFLNWIESKIGNRIQPIVIGDLDKKNAQSYFESCSLIKSFPYDNNLFEECYEIAGFKFFY